MGGSKLNPVSPAPIRALRVFAAADKSRLLQMLILPGAAFPRIRSCTERYHCKK